VAKAAARAAPNRELFEASLYIPPVNLPARPRHTIKQGDGFLVMDSHGDIGAASGGADGFFHNDTRFVSQLELRFNGETPLLLGSNVRDDNSALSADLSNPDILVDGRIVIERDTVHIVRTTYVHRNAAYQRLGIKNYSDRPVRFELSISFASDFADIFEVRGARRPRRGIAHPPLLERRSVLLRYEGLDHVERRAKIVFDPAPDDCDQRVARFQFDLQANGTTALFIALACDPQDSWTPDFFKGLLAARRETRTATGQSATVETSNAIFNEVLCRSMADLDMLLTDTPDGRYPFAGIPWYSTTFGRDGLITAQEVLWLNPSIARGVLKRLARYQATKTDREADAQPGKILHEMRGGEMAALREVPFKLYYGSVDATPLFVMLAGLYVERTGDLETLRSLWPAIEAALAWIDASTDADYGGFLTYQRFSDTGLVNQGWKDSYDSIFHADGSPAHGPIALAEVQGYVYAAKRLAARCAGLLGNRVRSDALDAQASGLAERFERAFWCPEIDTYALALDGEGKPCRVRASNAGQLLFTGIVRPDRAATVIAELLRPRYFSGWGIRTLASGEVRYNPMSYHNGSVWPHDNALIALGFARYGEKRAAGRILQALFDAAAYMELRRLPELYCGFARRRGRGPTLYPVACAPQAWAAGAPFLLLQASLGLTFDPARREICLHNPYLPPFLNHVRLRNARLCDATVDLMIHRDGDAVSVEVVRTQGAVRVLVAYGERPTAIT
jgi:glycogen debranching enzyme